MTKEEKERILRKKQEEIDMKFGSDNDYHEAISKNDKKLHISCYKCKVGCIHLEYESLMITCSEKEFEQLSDVIIRLRNALMIEKLQKEDEEFVLQGQFAH